MTGAAAGTLPAREASVSAFGICACSGATTAFAAEGTVLAGALVLVPAEVATRAGALAGVTGEAAV